MRQREYSRVFGDDIARRCCRAATPQGVPLGLKYQDQASSWTDAFRTSRARRIKRLALPLTGLTMLGMLLPLSQTPLFGGVVRAEEVAPVVGENVAPTVQNESPAPAENAAQVIEALPVFPSASQQPATTGEAKSAVETTPSVEAKTADSAATRQLKVILISAGQTRDTVVELAPENLTVGGALEAMGVKVDSLDRVTPPVKTPVYHGMRIRLVRVEARIVKRTVPVAPETRYKPTADIARGTKKTVDAGKSGLIEITERAWFKDGKATQREFISKKMVRAPKSAVVALGTRSAYVPSRIPYHNRYARAYNLSSRGGSPRDRMMGSVAPTPDPKTFRAVRSITLIATGYSPDPRENGGYTTTATGLPIGYGAAAVDPRVIPLGTKLYVEGYGYAFACDTGGAIKGKRIDLAYDSYRVANSKGRKKVKVWILEK